MGRPATPLFCDGPCLGLVPQGPRRFACSGPDPIRPSSSVLRPQTPVKRSPSPPTPSAGPASQEPEYPAPANQAPDPDVLLRFNNLQESLRHLFGLSGLLLAIPSSVQVATDQPAVRCGQAASHSSAARSSPRGLSRSSRPRKSVRLSVTSLPTFAASSSRTWAFSSSSVASED